MRRISLALALLAAALALPACSGSGTPTNAAEAHQPWWSGRTFYEVFVRSFKDSNGDGIGDFSGLTASLDYLNDGDPATTDDLGVTGIWLMPIFPSPSYHGYDVTDYFAVNPEYGTMDDFRAFLDAAHQRGIAVLIDLVINHTSDQHPWFQASAAGDPDYADWYVWRDEPPGWAGPWDEQVWYPLNGRFYYAIFWQHMPDLNLENPAVQAEIYDVARFWLEEVGVDGFRLDAAQHLVEEGPVQADTAATRAWLTDFTRYVHSLDPTALLLGEVFANTAVNARYVPGPLDLVFDFDFATTFSLGVQWQNGGPATEALQEAAAYLPGRIAPFLTNHDMDRVWSIVSGTAPAEVVPPIVRLAATVLLTAPGTPFVYYGEEIGLAGTKPDERIRTPMPWTGQAPGVGFTTGTPWEAPDPGYSERNVAAEATDPGSLLSLYRTMIQFRNQSAALRFGNLVSVATGNDGVAAYLRSAGNDHVLVVVNLTGQPITDYALTLESGPLAGVVRAETVIGADEVANPVVTAQAGLEGYRPLAELAPFTAVVIHLGT
jgi:alpha-amylase